MGQKGHPGQVCGATEPAGRPSNITVPLVGALRPATNRRKVVFPAPLAPTSPVTEPAGSETVQSFKAQRRP